METPKENAERKFEQEFIKKQRLIHNDIIKSEHKRVVEQCRKWKDKHCPETDYLEFVQKIAPEILDEIHESIDSRGSMMAKIERAKKMPPRNEEERFFKENYTNATVVDPVIIDQYNKMMNDTTIV